MALSVSACSAYNNLEQAQIDSVITALPHEVEGCTFLGEVHNNYGSFSILAARNLLKLQTAQLGGNHLVETNMAVSYDRMFPAPANWDTPFYGQDEFYLLGRAYHCPLGKGLISPERAALDKQAIAKAKALEEGALATKPFKDAKVGSSELERAQEQAAPQGSLPHQSVALPSQPFKVEPAPNTTKPQ